MNNLLILISLFGFSTLINAAEIPVQEKVERKCGGKESLDACKEFACNEAKRKALERGIGVSVESNTKIELKGQGTSNESLQLTEKQLKTQSKGELSKVEVISNAIVNDSAICEIKAVIISNSPTPNSQPVDLEKEFYRLFKLGVFQIDETHDYEAAVKSFNKALEIKPNNADAWFHRGFALTNLNRDAEAIKSYDNALQFEPTSGIWVLRGLAFGRLGRHDEAVTSYSKALEINPNDLKAYIFRGDALRELKRYNEALENYNKALKINPNFALAKNNRKLVLEQMLKEHEQKP